MIKEGNRIVATFEGGIYFDGKIYFSEYSSNDVFSYDLESKKTELLCKIVEEKQFKERLFSTLILYGKSLYLIPCSAEGIYCINIESKTYHLVALIKELGLKPDFECDENTKFMSAHLLEDTIYMVGATYPTIIKYEIKSNTVTLISDWDSKLREVYKNEDSTIFRKTYMMDGVIYAPCCKANAILIYDTKEQKSMIRTLGSEKDDFAAICCAETLFWLVGRHNSFVYKWRKNIDDVDKFVIDKKSNLEFCFGDIVYKRDYIYVIPQMSSILYGINTKTNRIDSIYSSSDCNLWMTYMVMDDNKLIAVSRETGEICIIEEGRVILCFRIILADEYNKYFSDIYRSIYEDYGKSKICIENESDTLVEYIEFLIKDYE